VPDAITSLWKDGYLQRLHLMPFTKDECVGLIEEALGGRVEGLSSDLMWEASGGNALFVRHLVEGALEAGTLRQVRGVWQLRGRTGWTSCSTGASALRLTHPTSHQRGKSRDSITAGGAAVRARSCVR